MIAALIVLGVFGISLIALVGAVEWMRFQEKIRIEKMYSANLDKCLDRIMARTYAEFKWGEAMTQTTAQAPPQPVPFEESYLQDLQPGD